MRASLALVLIVLAVSACTDHRDSALYDHRDRHGVRVESRQLVAEVKTGTPSVDEMAGLRALTAEYLRRPAAPVLLTGPLEQTAQLAKVLAGLGLSPERLTMAARQSGPIEVAAPVWQAVAPDCGHWDEEMTNDQANQNTWNFGCAVSRNIGLMVVDPADLVRARTESGRSGARAADVLEKYGKGAATSSAAEAGASGTLSSVGK